MATLDFKGKALVQNYHLTVKYHELVPKKDKSLTDKVRLDDNLIIHGDNLKALKALLPTYAGKVKCIYIDVPYNTGSEGWAYNDNVNSPMMQEWLGNAVVRVAWRAVTTRPRNHSRENSQPTCHANAQWRCAGSRCAVDGKLSGLN
jgi:hypothetical protein